MTKELSGVKLYVDWTQALERVNIIPGTKIGQTHGEALSISMGKISKWFTDIEATGIFNGTLNTTYTFTSGTDGSYTVLPSTTGATAQTVRVLPSTTASDENKVLMVDSTGAPVYTEQAWITNTANDLVNYYLKYNASGTGDPADKTKSTYNASEIDNMVSTIPKFKITVASTVPDPVTAEDATVYLVPNTGSGTNMYDEYIRVNKGTTAEPQYAMERLGTQDVDLTNYVQANQIGTGTTLGTITVKGTEVAVAGIAAAAGKGVATTISDASTDDNVPTAKAVFDYVDGIDTGVSSVSGTTGEITVDTSTGDVTVGLADTAVTAGSYGQTTAVTGDNNETVTIPYFTVDAKGRLTAAGTSTYTAKNDKVTQTLATGGATANFPLLMGSNAGAASGGEITTTTETTTTNKAARLYANVDGNNVTTLYSDVFVGNTTTQAVTDDSSKLANTAFVHDVVDQAITDLGNVVSSIEVGDSLAIVPATGLGDVTINIDNTITAQTTEALYTLTHNTQGLVTGSTAATGSTIRSLNPYSGAAGQITIGANGEINLATAGTAVTDGFKKITTDVYGRVTATSDVGASDIKGLTGIGMSGATASADGTAGLVPAPTATDVNKWLKGDGNWTVLPTATTSTAGITTLTTTYTEGETNKALTAAALDDCLSDLIIHCTA